MSVGDQYPDRSPETEQLVAAARIETYVELATTEVFPKKSCMCGLRRPGAVIGSIRR
jgi:hypothetical protein